MKYVYGLTGLIWAGFGFYSYHYSKDVEWATVAFMFTFINALISYGHHRLERSNEEDKEN